MRPCGAKQNPYYEVPITWNGMWGLDRNVGASYPGSMLAGAPIFDQVGPSCVGEATAQCLNAIARMRWGTPRVYSPLSIYYFSRVEEAKEFQLDSKQRLPDDGTYPFCAMRALEKHGVCVESSWPHSQGPKPPGWAAIAESERARHVRSYSIRVEGDVTIEALELALYNYCPVAITIPVTLEFQQYQGSKAWHASDLSHGVVGYHRVPILGIRAEDNAFIIRNSWKGQGDENQNCYLDRDLFYTDIPQDVEAFVEGP